MSRRRDRDHEDDFPLGLVTGDEAIDIVVDGITLGSKPLRQMAKGIREQQKRLRRRLDAEGWAVYLKLEELTNERASKQADLLVRWALVHGARSRR